MPVLYVVACFISFCWFYATIIIMPFSTVATDAPVTTTYASDPVSTTEATQITSRSDCNVEGCLLDYQKVVHRASLVPFRCHALRQLGFCMKQMPNRCAIEDERYILINSKRLESSQNFDCGLEGGNAFDCCLYLHGNGSMRFRCCLSLPLCYV